jgi:hypothetical protein
MSSPLTSTPDQVYSTAQAAELLGVSEGTLRSRKSRDKTQLIEGTHWLTQDSSTLWTVAGLLEIAERTDTPEAKALLQQVAMLVPTSPAMPTVDPSATPSATSPTETATDGVAIDVSFLEPLLEATGQSLALEFYRRLPTYVLKHIHRMAKHPTDDERRIIQAALQPIAQLQQEVREQCVS